MAENTKGYLIIIGGAEDKQGNSTILKQAPELIGQNDQLTVLTTATENPEAAGQKYSEAFGRLGVANIQILNINSRDDADNEAYCKKI